jgi:hypothetical protein
MWTNNVHTTSYVNSFFGARLQRLGLVAKPKAVCSSPSLLRQWQTPLAFEVQSVSLRLLHRSNHNLEMGGKINRDAK